jgi:hypothetical protein
MTYENPSFSIFERGKIVGLENASKTKIYHFGDLVLFEYHASLDGKYKSAKDAAKTLVDKQKVLLLKYIKYEEDWVSKNFSIGIFTEDQYSEISDIVNLARGDLLGNSGDLAYSTILHCIKENITTYHLAVKIINKKVFDDFQNNVVKLRKFEKERKESLEVTKRRLSREKNFIINNESELVNHYGINKIGAIELALDNWLSKCENLSLFFLESSDEITKIITEVDKFKFFIETSGEFEIVKNPIKNTDSHVEKEYKEQAKLRENRDFLIYIKTNYKVDHLYHFTSAYNLPLIRKYGLLGWETLQDPPYNLKEGYDFKASSDDWSRSMDKRDGWTDHIRLCKTKDHEMISAVRYRMPDLVFLKIKLEILTDPKIECQYANDNATVTSRPLTIDSNYKTFFESESNQAEVLITSHIPRDYILGKEV